MRWILAAATSLLCIGVGVAACRSTPRSSPEEIREQGYAELDRGNLDAALKLAEHGYDGAMRGGDPVNAWSLHVLQAEIMAIRRDALGVLNLLASPAPPGVRLETRARGLMTQGYAACQLVAHGDAEQRESAERFLAQAEQMAREIDSARLTAEVALRRGICDTWQRAHEQAEVRFRHALSVAQAAGLHLLEGQAATNLGLVRARTSRYDDAVDWFERSLDLSAGELVDVKLLSNLGWCYRLLGDTEKALPRLLKAEEIARRHGLTEDEEISLLHLGHVHIQLRDFHAARNYFEQSLAKARKLGSKDYQKELLGLLQTVAVQEKDFAAARAYADEMSALAASSGVPTEVPETILTEARLLVERHEFTEARRLYERLATPDRPVTVRWRALAGIANLEVALGRAPAAEQAFREAQDTIETMRAQMKQDTFDFLLHSSLNDFHGRYAAFLIDQARAREALALVDKNRGRVLSQRRASGARAAARAVERFEPAAEASRAVLLSYWLGERSFLWVVTRDSTEVHELPPASEIRSKVERYQNAVLRSRDPLEIQSKEATDLFRLIIEPAAARIPKGSRVIVVPDGALHQLSFDTLVAPAPTPHYWLEDVVLMRAPSLGLLTAERAPSAPPSHTLLAIGDPVQPNPKFPTLPNAAREMSEVAHHFPSAGTLVVTGSEATPSAYRAADPSRFAFIHFAAHATSHAEQPLESAVVLSHEKLGYKLYARDIVNMPIQANLVTLSACHGAGARTYRGEGLVGFAWAFLGAGAQNVVAGLWNVEDASTSRLMSGLYARLARGMPPPEALREARMELLVGRGAYRKPFYWGPFVMYVQQQAPSRTER